MQPGSVSLSEKFLDGVDGASVVATFVATDSHKWTRISVSTASGLVSVIEKCRDAGAAIICGENLLDGLPASADSQREYVFVELNEMREVIQHEPQDLVVSVQTGIQVASLNNYLAQYGQWFPVTAPPDATLVDVLNHGNGGLLEHGFGTVRDLVLGLEVVTGGAIAIKSGGTVVKNVTGYDTTKLFVGSHATLGVPHVAHLRLYARPEKSAGLLFHSSKPADLLQLGNNLIGADLTLSCCELIDLDRAKTSTSLKEGTRKLTQRWGDFGLLVKVSGPDELLKEIVPQIREFKVETTTNTELSVDDTDDLIAIYSKPLHPRLELSASVSEMMRMLTEWMPDAAVRDFQYRPSTGRLHISAADLQHLERMHASLRSYLLKVHEPNMVALAANSLELKIDYLGSDVNKVQQIKASLKEKFDPMRCLNPLVHL